jgi:hypothetical protein
MFRRSVITALAGTLVACALTVPAGAAGRRPTVSNAPYWRGWDIVRGIALRHSGSGGYVLDAWGGVHPFGGAPALVPSHYTRNRPFAVGLGLAGDDAGGVVINLSGHVYDFGVVASTVTTCGKPANIPLRGLSFDPTPVSGPPVSYLKHGATIDALGGIHLLCGSPALDTTGAPAWMHFPIARGIAITQDGAGNKTGGFVLDGWGGVHPFGHAHLATSPRTYWRGWDIARGIAVDGHGHGVVVDGWGGVHPFTYTVS